MSGISWNDLMRFGLCDLQLEPNVFWELTPVELMLLAGKTGSSSALSKSGLDALMQSYPDKKAE